MSEQNLTIYEALTYHLRAINHTDLENLRVWKNTNKQFFFHAGEISIEQQATWYKGFALRPNDHMFMVEELLEGKVRKVGCMGYRVNGAIVDVYNIMRGQPSLENRFTMAQAFLLMIAYAAEKEKMPITCVVLKNNPALNWYSKNGFEVKVDQGESVLLQMDADFLKSKKILVKVKK